MHRLWNVGLIGGLALGLWSTTGGCGNSSTTEPALPPAQDSGQGGSSGSSGSPPGGAGGSQPDASGDAVDECAKPNCGTECVDLLSDPHNCGQCAHDCRGGLCDAGVCVLPESAYTIPILSLAYYPVNGAKLDKTITGTDATLKSVREHVAKTQQQLLGILTKSSTYHGFSDFSATPSLQFAIHKQLEYYEALPVSKWVVNWDGKQFYPDYTQILERENICDLVDKAGVKEVWLWAYHYGDVAPATSNMAGPFGDVSNQVEAYDDMPTCSHTYVLYHYNYSNFAAGLGWALGNQSFQMETTLKRVDKDALFMDTFASPMGDETGVNGCGLPAYPPNYQNDPWQWYLKTSVKSDCEDWNPQRSGKVTDVSCLTWCDVDVLGNCIDDMGTRFLSWWMQNHPGKGHQLKLNDKPLRNWWDVKADFDIVMASDTGLLQRR